MNGFLGSHRILSVDRRWVDRSEDSLWVFCVDYLDSPKSPVTSGEKGFPGQPRNKVDYREQLSPEDFIVFVRLRELRKQMA